ncbi:hypothetical protein C1752_01748 [Acaryochloris thomasi RCC1774]|uniref:DUF433 domain-containing protein n=1 Tax=Acaryochloris thomasi RCC1774 TaxID=1764569 RepID=A0A2W1JKW3_9CYAN|nr:DUF433 domain-containing protein [Acaryochloris thomasi]PZD74009.1 hypothetical protein C1752_01748 [Acaryochloris thomasi RCC1774]
MTLQQLHQKLLALTPEEKAQAIQLLVGSLSDIWIGIEKNSGVMGGDACIRQTRITVWQLISLRHQGATEADLLEDYPALTAADLTNAWHYADLHTDEIEAALQRQAAA